MRRLWVIIIVLGLAILLLVAKQYRSSPLNVTPDAARQIEKAKQR